MPTCFRVQFSTRTAVRRWTLKQVQHEEDVTAQTLLMRFPLFPASRLR
jgi:hypothetical protein